MEAFEAFVALALEAEGLVVSEATAGGSENAIDQRCRSCTTVVRSVTAPWDVDKRRSSPRADEQRNARSEGQTGTTRVRRWIGSATSCRDRAQHQQDLHHLQAPAGINIRYAVAARAAFMVSQVRSLRRWLRARGGAFHGRTTGRAVHVALLRAVAPLGCAAVRAGFMQKIACGIR